MEFPTYPSPRRALRHVANALALIVVAVLVAWAFVHFDLWKVGLMLFMLPVAFLWGAWEEFEKAVCEWSGTPYEYDEGAPLPGLVWSVDEDGITLREDGGQHRRARLRFENLASVRIRTTSLGPFVEDFFYVLSDGEATLEVPLGIACAEGLVDHLFALPGFDHKAVIEASGSTDDAVFVAWESGSDGAV